MPPKGPPRAPPPSVHGGRTPIALERDALDRALTAVVPDARDRAFVLRCVLDEGPRHHRVASWALLRMLVATLEALGDDAPDLSRIPVEPLRMRLPPNVASASEDGAFPIGLPTRLLGETLDPEEQELAVACLSDGPPHHALANAVMAWLIEAIHAKLRSEA